MIDIVTYGGGIQSTTIAALIVAGRLPRPECIVMADTGRERSAVWDYLEEITQPRLRSIGLQIEIVPHSYSYVDLVAKNGDLLLPVFTETGKLPTFCSDEWKQRPVRRYLREKGYGPTNPIRLWFGMSLDEYTRMSKADVKWLTNYYPLILDRSIRFTRADCISFLKQEGWPTPPKSACFMCPHRDNDTWQEMKDNEPQDFAAAVALEQEIRAGEWGDIWLHKSRTPLDEVTFDSSDSSPLFDLCADTCWT